MVAIAPSFLVARVMHKRMLPRVHAFHYDLFYLCFPLNRIKELANAFLSLDRWNLLSFYNKDHGAHDGSDSEQWMRTVLKRHGLRECDGDIVLIALPRILGYVFNPVSFWLCLDKQGELRAVLSEVNNTFGEHHCYLSYRDDHGVIAADEWLESRRMFHVSPFLDVRGTYKFRFALSGDRVFIQIDLYDEGKHMLTTSVTGRTKSLSSRRTIGMFMRYPLVTFKTIAMIHVEAVRLLAKGMKYRPKPALPQERITR